MVQENEPLMHHQHHDESHHRLHAAALEVIPTIQNVYSDNISSASSATLSPPKPATSLETDDDLDKELFDLEDGYCISGKRERDWTGKGWWGVKDIMTVRARRKGSVDSSEFRDEGKTLLDGKTRGKRRTRFSYCIFGSIGVMAITATLLATNLLLTAVTLYWNTDPDDIFKAWGGIGSGTEGLNWWPSDFTRDIQPIACHSHNDYWRQVPLFSALRHGCISVEADVWLFDDVLFVGHNSVSLTRSRTFTSLYIDPLVRILERQNPHTEFYNGTGNGVFDVDPEQSLTLLIDVKTSGAETWPWVLKQLEPLRERGWLTFVEGGKVHTRAVTVVGTGNTRFDVLTQNTTYRDAFFDSPLDTMWEPATDSASTPSPSSKSEVSSKTPSSKPLQPHDLGQGLSGTTPSTEFNAQNSYYASVSLRKAIGLIWHGNISPAQLEIIRGQIRGAHKRGLKVRYWDLPAWPIGTRDRVWRVLVDEGADILNVDDLQAVKRGKW
ncbi:hypothetical protein VTL71DRAFT_15 [Oculimacula yallundae]|uniref:Altered inheritance of mitochondria protein 6 n=1 Tax=Oculimacula yallundae TaxID=86028 RepID=A0ABR4CYZ1_9HELO